MGDITTGVDDILNKSIRYLWRQLFEEELEKVPTSTDRVQDLLYMLEKARGVNPAISARLKLSAQIVDEFPERATRHIIIAARQLQAGKRRFLNFNPVEEVGGTESAGYDTQPGSGHEMPSGMISMDETGQGNNVDMATDIWNKGKNISRTDYPVGENSKPTGFRGPHNDRELVRFPARTTDNFIAPRGVPR